MGVGIGGKGSVVTPFDVTVADIGHGNYSLAYTPMISGAYDLHVDLRVAEGLYGTYFSQVRRRARAYVLCV